MSRRFSRGQRLLLALLADGKCEMCGVALPADFHADHIKPWSKQGQTVLSNGQALCASCNTRKGASEPGGKR